MNEFKATDKWYKEAAENDMYWDTADVKTCPHHYVFKSMCPECSKEKCKRCGNDKWIQKLSGWICSRCRWFRHSGEKNE